jgi:hypothetical protein
VIELLEMGVPGKGHEDIAATKQRYGKEYGAHILVYG